MARIADGVIERLKTEVSVQRLAEARGVVRTKHGADLMCTALGCYTTPAEKALAEAGNYLGYYQLACAGVMLLRVLTNM